MRNSKILVVEDDALLAMQLKVLLDELGFVHVFHHSNVSEALKFIKSDRPELILMDIRLGEALNGIELISLVRELYQFALIYTTSDSEEQTIKEAAKTNPEAYLVKPIKSNQLLATIELAISRIKQSSKENKAFRHLEDDAIFVKIGKELKRIELGEIAYFESAKDRYCDVILDKKVLSIRNSLSDLEVQLSKNGFIRVHRSILLNLSKVVGVNSDGNIVLTNGAEVPLGAKYKSLFLEKLRILG